LLVDTPVPRRALSALTDDLTMIAERIERLGPRTDPAYVDLLVELLDDAVAVADLAVRPTPANHGATSPVALTLGRAYGADAAADRRAEMWLYAAMAAMFAAAVTCAVVALMRAEAATLWRLWGFFVVSGLLAVSGVLLWVQAERHRRASNEARRVQRHLSGVDWFLGDLPDEVRHLLQAPLAQRLFPRTLDDDDPLREPVWPVASDVVKAIHLHVARQERRAYYGSSDSDEPEAEATDGAVSR
jgi:hypothetical protein